MVVVSPVKRHRTFIELLPIRIHASLYKLNRTVYWFRLQIIYRVFVTALKTLCKSIHRNDEVLLILRPTFEPEDHPLSAVEYQSVATLDLFSLPTPDIGLLLVSMKAVII
jgi:hypothetical protein